MGSYESRFNVSLLAKDKVTFVKDSDTRFLLWTLNALPLSGCAYSCVCAISLLLYVHRNRRLIRDGEKGVGVGRGYGGGGRGREFHTAQVVFPQSYKQAQTKSKPFES